MGGRVLLSECEKSEVMNTVSNHNALILVYYPKTLVGEDCDSLPTSEDDEAVLREGDNSD